MGNPRFTSFLMSPPYYSTPNPPGDNLAEPEVVDTPYGDWYIRHGPFDYRYMAAQTIINGFLSYERRFGLGSVFEYAELNFSGSLGNPQYSLWLTSQCQQNQYASSFQAARLVSNRANSYSFLVGWLNEYMNCLSDLDSDYTTGRVHRATNTTILPQAQQAINDFYSTPWDPTNGAFSVLAANFGNGSLAACAGGCTLQCTGSVVYVYEASTYVCFLKPVSAITQVDIDAAYQTHIDHISTYWPNRDSVVQPILWVIHNDTLDAPVIGYVWLSGVYQLSVDQTHIPR